MFGKLLLCVLLVLAFVSSIQLPAVSHCFTSVEKAGRPFCTSDENLGWRVNLASSEDQPLDALRACLTEMQADLTQTEMASVLWKAGFVFHNRVEAKSQVSREIPFTETGDAFVMTIPVSKIFNRDRCISRKLEIFAGYMVDFKPDEGIYQVKANPYWHIDDH